MISFGSKPHGVLNAMASSIQPSAFRSIPVLKFSWSIRRMPASATTCRSTSGISPSRSDSSAMGLVRMASAFCTRVLCNRERFSRALRYSRTLDSVIPSNQSSMSSASGGARLTSTAALLTRSDSFAAQASACGPPPDRPTTEKSFNFRKSAMSSTSAAASTTCRPGTRVEPPYPGRS